MLKNAPVVMMLLACAGCDKVPLLAPTGSTITLTAPARILPTGGTTDVTATVLEASGSPVQNGTTVRFTATLGRVDPVDVQTVNGVAITRFFAGDSSGVAEIRANSGAAGGGSTGGTGGTTTATNVLQITVGAAAAESVVIRANPSSVSPNGGTVDVIATVLGTGNRTLSNVPVSFSTTRGSLSNTTATSDGNGDARVQLTTNVEADVTASVGAKTATIKVTVRATPVVMLACSGTSGGTGASTCTQVVGQPVVFTAGRGQGTTNLTNATLAFGDGSSTALGNLTSIAVVTHAYESSGTFTARVTATDVNGEQTAASVVVTINPRAPMNLTVTANPTSQRINMPVQFTATLGSGDTTQISSYRWEFINDSTGNTEATVTTSGNTTSRVFSTPGTRTVRVTATAVDGRTATAETQFVITAT